MVTVNSRLGSSEEKNPAFRGIADGPYGVSILRRAGETGNRRQGDVNSVSLMCGQVVAH
jgi:hypothetical protein